MCAQALPTDSAKAFVGLVAPFSIFYAGSEIILSSRKAQALIVYLILSDSGSELRERIAAILWSETEETKARQSLRQVIRELRSAFGASGELFLRIDNTRISIDKDFADTDIWQVESAAISGIPHNLLLETQFFFDGLCVDLETVDPAFQSWLRVKRQLLRESISHALEASLREVVNGPGQEECARALLNIDPTNEVAARALIQCRIQANDAGGALSVYRALWDLLEDEYDVEPSQETQALIADFKLSLPEQQEDMSPAAVPVSFSEPQILDDNSDASVARQPIAGRQLVIAIDQFDKDGTSSENRYLVDGFRSDLIACLVRFREWRLIDTPKTSNHAAQAELLNSLGAFSIEGSAYQIGGRIRLILLLRDTVTSVILWSERLQLDSERWFEAQETVIKRIATALNVHVSAERMFQISDTLKANLDAFDLWLQGQTLIQSFQPDSWRQANEIMGRITEIDPHFSPAYSSRAQLHNIVHLVHYGVFRTTERADKAISLAQEAVRLDAIDSRAHLSLGWANLMANRYEKAAFHYSLARDLNENDPWTLVSSALGLAFSGEYDVARDLAERALDLSLTPNATNWGYQMRIRMLQGDIGAAVDAAENAARVPALRGWWSVLLSLTDKRDEAADEFALFVSEAQSGWLGEEGSDPEAISRWFLHSFPIRSEESWLRLRDGLAHAGAPVGRLTHQISDIRELRLT